MRKIPRKSSRASYGVNMCLGRVESRPGSDTSGGRSDKKDCVIVIRGSSNRSGGSVLAEMGMLLPDETYEARSTNVPIADADEIQAAKALAALRRCDEFLKKHGIRPEFFCRHRERLALQAWLLKKFNLYSGECSKYLYSHRK